MLLLLLLLKSETASYSLREVKSVHIFRKHFKFVFSGFLLIILSNPLDNLVSIRNLNMLPSLYYVTDALHGSFGVDNVCVQTKLLNVVFSLVFFQ